MNVVEWLMKKSLVLWMFWSDRHIVFLDDAIQWMIHILDFLFACLLHFLFFLLFTVCVVINTVINIVLSLMLMLMIWWCSHRWRRWRWVWYEDEAKNAIVSVECVDDGILQFIVTRYSNLYMYRYAHELTMSEWRGKEGWDAHMTWHEMHMTWLIPWLIPCMHCWNESYSFVSFRFVSFRFVFVSCESRRCERCEARFIRSSTHHRLNENERMNGWMWRRFTDWFDRFMSMTSIASHRE
jgi:hypothetical protein